MDGKQKKRWRDYSKKEKGTIFVVMWLDFLKRGRKEEEKKEKRFILSIDGGGMRGIVPAYILKKMDEELKARGITRPLYSYFDLIAGTSTGALIAMALSAPIDRLGLEKEEGEDWKVTRENIVGRWRRRVEIEEVGAIERLADPTEILDLYRVNGNKIFIPDDTKGIWKLVGKVTRMLGDKYDVAPLEEFLDSVFSDTPLSEAKVPTMAVSTNAKGCTPFIFRSWDSHGFLYREAARATSAAPTYFAPAQFIDRETDEELTLLDGGLLANNPVLLSYVEGRKLYPEADEMRILSLSTASPECILHPEEYSTNLDWLSSLTSAYSSGNMKVSEMAAESIKGVKVDRIWENVLEKKIKLDDTSEEAVSELMEAAEKIWEQDKDKIFSFLDEVTKENVHSSLKLKAPLMLPSGEN